MAPWEAEAIHHAREMNKYIAAQSTSAQVLAQDPTRRDKLASALKESTAPNVRHELVDDANDDIPALFRDWNGAIEKEPTTFEEHFYRVHYASIAAVYYDYHILSPLVQKHGSKFFEFYSKKLSELHLASMITPEPLPQPHLNAGRRTPPSPPGDLTNIDHATAVALLADPDALLALRFFQRDEAISGFWSVKSINSKTTRDGNCVTYQIAHGDELDEFEVDSEIVMDLLLGSCKVED